MLTIEQAERDGHLVLVAIDPEVKVDGEVYADWTAVSSMHTTTTMMAMHLEAAKQRLINRHARAIRFLQPKTLAERGRVAVAPVIVIEDIRRSAEDAGPGEGLGFTPRRPPPFSPRRHSPPV